jgi:hypothetical protein
MSVYGTELASPMWGVFDAGVTIWKSGMEHPESENADCSTGEPMMTLSQLVKAKNERKSLLDIAAELERFLPDRLPPLSVSDKDWIDPEQETEDEDATMGS